MVKSIKRDRQCPSLKKIRLPRFERGTLCLEGRCSIQLSYQRKFKCLIIIYAHRAFVKWKNGFSQK